MEQTIYDILTDPTVRESKVTETETQVITGAPWFDEVTAPKTE